MKFPMKDSSLNVTKSSGKCRKLQIWSHFLKKSLMENLIFCAVKIQKLVVVNFQVTSTLNVWRNRGFLLFPYFTHIPYVFTVFSADLPSLMVLPWDSRFWFESHGATVNWDVRHFSSLELFHILKHKNNSNWSLTISTIQIGKFQINSVAWFVLGANFIVWSLSWSILVCT